jgi:hypothetical protein
MFHVLNILKKSIPLIKLSASFASISSDHTLNDYSNEGLKIFRESLYYKTIIWIFEDELGSAPEHLKELAKTHSNLKFIITFILNDSFDKGLSWRYPCYNAYGLEITVEDLVVLSYHMYASKLDTSNFTSLRLEFGYGFGDLE